VSAAAGPVVVVGAVALVEDRLLLVRRSTSPAAGTWSIPGGRVERFETLHEAVVRETSEETGLRVVVHEFLGWVERMGDEVEGHHFLMLDFAVTPLDDPDLIEAGDDAAEVEWVPTHELSDYRLAPGLFEFLVDVHVLSG
jgi:ADP-ribose pyrophosphatase YjhB (NUDIX family)